MLCCMWVPPRSASPSLNYVGFKACWQNIKRSPRSSHHKGINQAENTKTTRKTPSMGCAASDTRSGSRAKCSYLDSLINTPLGKCIISGVLLDHLDFRAKQSKAPAAF